MEEGDDSDADPDSDSNDAVEDSDSDMLTPDAPLHEEDSLSDMAGSVDTVQAVSSRSVLHNRICHLFT